MTEWPDRIEQRLIPYKKKYYLDLLIRGALLTVGLLISWFLIAVFSEYLFWLSRGVRFFLLFSFIGFATFCFIYFLARPVKWFVLRKGMSSDEAARKIGASMSSVEDRLLNLLQLSRSSSGPLAQAAVEQRFRDFGSVSFEKTIDISLNKKFLPWLLVPVVIVILVAALNFKMVSEPAERILQFNKEFVPEAPFKFEITNPNLQAYYGEDFTLQVQLTGSAIPEIVQLEQNGLQHTLVKKDGAWSFVFEKVSNNQSFRLYAAGFYSPTYRVEVISRPEITGIQTRLIYPSYLNLKSESLTNSGNLEIPEGTNVQWSVSAMHSEKATIVFSDGKINPMQSSDKEIFSYNKSFFNDDHYVLGLENENARNRDKMEYSIRVIKDAYPEIITRQAGDSVLYKNLYLGGTISDDHGLTDLSLSWQIIRNGNEAGPFEKRKINFDTRLSRQDFFFAWALDSVDLQPDDQLNYFLTVSDNDGVNGKKSTKTGLYTFRVPGTKVLEEKIRETENKTTEEIKSGFEKAKALSESIKEAQKELRGKQSMNWDDKARIDEILRQKQEMEKALEQLKKEHEKLSEQRSAFDEQDERIREKTEQLQKLMEEVLDEETKKLFRELEKLLKENANADQMQKMLDKIRRNEINVEKELDRIKELFNQLKLEAKIDQAINRLEQHIRDQESLLKKTEEIEKSGGDREKKAGSQSQEQQQKQEDLSRQQEGIKENLNDDREMMEEIKELAEEAGEDDPAVPEKEDFDQAGEEMEKSKENLKGGENKKSSESQKKAIQKMKQMQARMEQMQSSMEMEMDEANMELLRQILHGVLKLSFDQERYMKEFGTVQLSDPSYLTISQLQLKLQDDAKVLEDSLLSLGKKDMALGSFVTREVGDLNHHLDRAAEFIRERKKSNASSEMQLSMTSMNNLALMLNDHFQQMMSMMSKSGKGKKKSKGDKKPSLSEMQQKLNEQIEQLKKGGKSGRELSEELAQMAAEQERIRKALQNLQEKLEQQNGQKPGGDIPAKMEQTEMDLVNKRITEQTIRRQKEILNRLLETEKSVREQEFDQERKGETAKEYENQMPKAFQEYLKQKEKEVELLKTVPPKLYPYFKKEASDYFQRLGQPRDLP
ncbi:MAG: DUF4175 family protein [Cyclobacteriaceae bacterium]